ncbi:hypothetical protein ABMA28_006810 [Loxostege sticticalis]|uniref:Uncharacterized protein n=1 Tax=Loxostege sticticalis TaxID=481309 RepID=A0ABD0SA63_LOXSC
MENSDDTNIMLSQYTYDPWEGLTQACQEIMDRPETTEPQATQALREKKVRRKAETKKKRRSSAKSYVINRERLRGIRLIQIRVSDLTSEPSCSTVRDPEHSDSEDNVVLSAQYVVTEHNDEIMDMTDSVIRKISKKLCRDNL